MTPDALTFKTLTTLSLQDVAHRDPRLHKRREVSHQKVVIEFWSVPEVEDGQEPSTQAAHDVDSEAWKAGGLFV